MDCNLSSVGSIRVLLFGTEEQAVVFVSGQVLAARADAMGQ